MLKMTYDCAIEENMMNYAKECKFAHNSYKDRNYWGQNLYMTSARNINKTRAAENSVSAWFSELEHKGVPKENRLTMEVFNHGVGHYSQARKGAGPLDCCDWSIGNLPCDVINRWRFHLSIERRPALLDDETLLCWMTKPKNKDN
uniref:SCP domain-containing protein n=1 Tax=Haemonchus contortus TaxID=6289 RepID=A0A7I5ECC6_HAECO